MGLIDRFLHKKTSGLSSAAAPAAAATPGASETTPTASVTPSAETPGPAPVPAIEPVSPGPVAAVPPPAGAAVLARLRQAREALDLKNLAGAMAIYEEVLASAGDRPDVLVTISGDLGVSGRTQEIIELIVPRYDAQRHGPATGINLLQAYLAVRDPESAQHVLDQLFALNRPEIEERLFGFSNVIADMLLLDAKGEMLPTPSPDAPVGAELARIDLVNISKPIWFYGLENIPGLLPPKEGKRRRVAFGQLALLGLENSAGSIKQPEDELGRLSRGIPLWLSEVLFFSAGYASVAAVATMRREQYGLFAAEWAPEHIRQLVDTSEGGLDYVFTGALRQEHADYKLVLRLWEVKKFRERKAFTVRWAPATADQTLAQFSTQLRAFMEVTPHPAGQGLAYAPPAKLRDYIEALGAGLTLFLGEKQVLPPAQLVLPTDLAARLGMAAAESEFASLLLLGLLARARRLGLAGAPSLPALAGTPAVAQAKQGLGL
jgi:hypothetical protein